MLLYYFWKSLLVGQTPMLDIIIFKRAYIIIYNYYYIINYYIVVDDKYCKLINTQHNATAYRKKN